MTSGAVNAALPASCQFTPEAVLEARQQRLSLSLDKAVFDELYAQASPPVQANLLSEKEVGAREFLVAIPNDNDALSRLRIICGMLAR